jgi:tetratricopeptide (TPR) repeat protein
MSADPRPLPVRIGPLRLALAAAGLALATAWVYSPVWHGGWIWDDPAELTQNPALRADGGLAAIWSGASGVDYFPLKTTVEWAEWRCWGGDPAGYHAVNLGLHLLSAFLLWHLLRRLGVRWAWLGGLLFAIHPMAVESVAWVSELKNTLSLALVLLALAAHLEFDGRESGRPGAGRGAWYAASLGCFVLAMLSKSTVAMFPAILLLFAWWKRGRVTRREVGAIAPFFGVALVLGLVTVWFQHQRAIAGIPLGLGGWPSRLAVAGLAAGFYLAKGVLPLALSPIYPRWNVSPPSAAQFLPWLGLALAIGWLASRRGNWRRAVWLGLGWFFLNLIPVLGLVPMAYQRISWVADHLAYLSLAGLAGLAAAGAGALQERISPRRPWPLAVGVGVICVLLAAESHRYAGVFRDEASLWTYTLERNPAAWLAQNNLGKVLYLDGRRDAAAERFRRALELYPDDAEAHFNLALVLADEGRTAEAAAEDAAALRLRPAFPEAENSVGNGHLRAGRPAEAVSAYAEAIRLNPDYPEARANRGAAYLALGRLPEAVADLAEALRLRPDFPEAHFNLGNALQRSGRPADAIAQYREALAERPGYAEACNSLGLALAATNRLPEAVPFYEQALRLRPDYPEAHFNLGNAWAQAGRTDEAIAEYQKALRGEPGSPEAHNNLGILLAEAGRLAEAGAQFREALRLQPDYPAARANLARIQADRPAP